MPKEQRFDPIKFDLHVSCDQLNVEYPKDSALMPQYASAYFMRRVYLHENPGYKVVGDSRQPFRPETSPVVGRVSF